MKKLKRHEIDWAQIGRFLASAEKKLASAHKILAVDEDACLQQAYEAMLKAALEGCERYYQAFQFVVWAGRESREALASAMFETEGRAQ